MHAVMMSRRRLFKTALVALGAYGVIRHAPSLAAPAEIKVPDDIPAERARRQLPSLLLRSRTPSARHRRRQGARARPVAYGAPRGPRRSHAGVARREALSRPPRLALQVRPRGAVDESRLDHGIR